MDGRKDRITNSPFKNKMANKDVLEIDLVVHCKIQKSQFKCSFCKKKYEQKKHDILLYAKI